MEKDFFACLEFLKTFNLVDSEYFINNALAEGRKVLAEGAQGSLLDIDFGSYPFVTSSNTMAAGACTGLGIAPAKVGKVYGIFKAYCTRVGAGPFPTELFDKDGETLAEVGNEFGSTTGRARRCGWLDLPALNYAVMLNGVTTLLMMKTDVLNGFDKFKVCTHYKYEDGSITDMLPYDLTDEKVEPIYEEFDGWSCDLSAESMNDFVNLPEQLKKYILFIEEKTGVKVELVSCGPDRKETIMKDSLLVPSV